MAWNYRVVKHIHGDGQEILYAIHEVYYHDDGTVREWTERDVSPTGDSPQSFRESLMRYKAAMKRPVLVIRDDQAVGDDPALQLGVPRFSAVWQPIETAPKDLSTVVGYTPHALVLVGDMFYAPELESWRRLPDDTVRPTHWMALPAPPGAALSEGDQP